MNLIIGGEAFSSGEVHMKISSKGGKAFSESIKNNLEIRKKHNKIQSSRFKKLHQEGKIIIPDWTGKKHSEESKKKMSLANRTGDKNSQYGTCWITNEIENKKIHKVDLIPEGWRLGRKIKTNP
jgi:hypothetical protein